MKNKIRLKYNKKDLSILSRGATEAEFIQIIQDIIFEGCDQGLPECEWQKDIKYDEILKVLTLNLRRMKSSGEKLNCILIIKNIEHININEEIELCSSIIGISIDIRNIDKGIINIWPSPGDCGCTFEINVKSNPLSLLYKDIDTSLL